MGFALHFVPLLQLFTLLFDWILVMCCLVILKPVMYQMLMSKFRLKVRKTVLIIQGVRGKLGYFFQWGSDDRKQKLFKVAVDTLQD